MIRMMFLYSIERENKFIFAKEKEKRKDGGAEVFEGG